MFPFLIVCIIIIPMGTVQYNNDQSVSKYKLLTKGREIGNIDEKRGDSSVPRPFQPNSYLGHNLGYYNHLMKPRLKKKKTFKGRKAQLLITLLTTILDKINEILPIIKLAAAAFAMLILLTKKTFLISVGSFILFLYESFYRKKCVRIVKNSGNVPYSGLSQHMYEAHVTPLEDEAYWNRDISFISNREESKEGHGY